MKHKHCDVIKAWAEGAEIEVLDNNKWYTVQNPSWDPYYSYRIKPELIELERYIFLHNSEQQQIGLALTIQTNVKFTFDPDTKQLIKVELI